MSDTAAMNGTTRHHGHAVGSGKVQDELLQLNLQMKNLKYDDKYAKYHGDKLIGVCPLCSPLQRQMLAVIDPAAGQGCPKRILRQLG